MKLSVEIYKRQIRGIKLVAVLCFILMALSACSNFPITPEQYIRIAAQQGTLSIKSIESYQPFSPDMVKIIPDYKIDSEIQPECSNIIISSAPSFYPAMAATITRNSNSLQESIPTLQQEATSTALTSLVDGTQNLVIATRPNSEQQASIDASGRNIVCVPIAHEALIFYMRDDDQKLPHNLDSAELMNWFEHPTSAVHPFVLSHGNGSTTCFEKFLGHNIQDLDHDMIVEVPEMYSIIAATSLTDSSIGYAYNQFYEYGTTSNVLNKVAVDGVYPGQEEITAGEYPLMYDVVALYDADSPQISELEHIVTWLLSDDVQSTFSVCGMQSKS